jgi:hypothetical protein
MAVSVSWSFSCRDTTQNRSDPFDIELPDGSHPTANGVSGYGSTHFTNNDANMNYTVTAYSDCSWTVSGTMTPG